MADLGRAEALVHAMEQDSSFQQQVESAPTAAQKREILDQHGWRDVTLDDMKAYAESMGGKLVVKSSDRELSDQELDTVVGGWTETDSMITGTVIGVAVAGAGAAAIAAAV